MLRRAKRCQRLLVASTAALKQRSIGVQYQTICRVGVRSQRILGPFDPVLGLRKLPSPERQGAECGESNPRQRVLGPAVGMRKLDRLPASLLRQGC